MDLTLDIARILDLFALFSDLPDQQLFNWKSLCQSAAAAICSRLHRDVDVAAHMERLCTAAAAWAYSDYLMLNANAAGEEIRVGDISLKSVDTNANMDAQELRGYFMEQISDLTAAAHSFAFRQTGESA